ncbi:squalene epoxidase 3 [Raphanus sativus]|uniref:squalene monooxygenase n=1 Tax=Raphanus sativus TaxID=3726 RepID=A0A6J0NKT9_RAPSA|nr:squalene epoxidase 3 [Raphanus sativus]
MFLVVPSIGGCKSTLVNTVQGAVVADPVVKLRTNFSLTLFCLNFFYIEPTLTSSTFFRKWASFKFLSDLVGFLIKAHTKKNLNADVTLQNKSVTQVQQITSPKQKRTKTMKLAVIQNLPRLGLTITTASLRSSPLPSLISTRRLRNPSLTTRATFTRRKKDIHQERASLISAGTITMPPAIEFDQFILATFFASLFALVLVYVLRRSSRRDDADSNRSKKNRGLVQNDAVVSRNVADSGIDVIIVGAGVAGAALAHTLGKEGRRVHVIERDLSEQDRIVGELLQPGGYLKLIELGLEDCVKEIDAQRVLGYALFKDGKHTKLSYPLEAFDSDVSGRSFHNGRFVQRMRDKAATLSNVRLEQGTVTSLLEENGTVKGVQYKNKEGNEIRLYAPLTVVCDGCFSNLRRSLCKPKVDVPSTFVGLVLENCELPFANHGHVVLADPSPILLYPISSSQVRCLVDVPGQKLPPIANGEMAKYLKTHVAPQLPPEVREAFIAAVEKGNIKTMPNRSMPADPVPVPGALLLGDAFNMRHPLTGGGMTVALADIVVLRDLLRPIRSFKDKEALSKYIESFYTLRKPVASTINTLAGALYKVFLASADEAKTEMREACFDYLSLGGVCSSGPVALLSGLNPRPLSLVLHFFAVALFAVGRLMLPFPSIKSFWLGARVISSASGIIFPIIKAEGVRQMFFPRTVAAIYRTPPPQ